jgi:hypothetical protein
MVEINCAGRSKGTSLEQLLDLRTLILVYASRNTSRSRESWEIVYSRRTSKRRAETAPLALR